MASATPTATSLDALAASRLVVASFHAGNTAGGHHWTLEDDQGEQLARTRRVHSGGRLARAAWKTVTLTGLDAGNDIHVELVGAGDAVLARLSSANAKPPTVTVHGGEGLERGATVREDGHLTLSADGRALAVLSPDGDGPWPVLDGGGARLGELLAGDPGPSTTPTWTELLLPVAPTNSGDFARTMHLGLRRVVRYAFAPAGGAAADPVVALLPLLCGLTY